MGFGEQNSRVLLANGKVQQYRKSLTMTGKHGEGGDDRGCYDDEDDHDDDDDDDVHPVLPIKRNPP